MHRAIWQILVITICKHMQIVVYTFQIIQKNKQVPYKKLFFSTHQCETTPTSGSIAYSSQLRQQPAHLPQHRLLRTTSKHTIQTSKKNKESALEIQIKTTFHIKIHLLYVFSHLLLLYAHFEMLVSC